MCPAAVWAPGSRAGTQSWPLDSRPPVRPPGSRGIGPPAAARQPFLDVQLDTAEQQSPIRSYFLCKRFIG